MVAVDVSRTAESCAKKRKNVALIFHRSKTGKLNPPGEGAKQRAPLFCQAWQEEV